MSSSEPSPDRLGGLAHVATVSFLGSRLAPSGQFWVALAGGVALARAGGRHGLRAGYGASCAAILETVALIGPARVNGPLTQALSAPLVGKLHARHTPVVVQFAACGAIRLAHYAVLNVLAIWLVVGGLDEYVKTYDKLVGWLPVLPEGQTAAILLTVAANLGWATFYTVIQVLAYRRALRRWPEGGAAGPDGAADRRTEGIHLPRRAGAIALAVIAGWTALLASPTWPEIGAVGGALAALWVVVPARERAGVKLGLALAAVLAAGALLPVIVGAVGADLGTRRALRAALLVLIAMWARAAAGAEGVRALAGALLWRARRVPGAREAAHLTTLLRSDGRLIPAARDLAERLQATPMRPLPLADALTAWAVQEASEAPVGPGP